MRLIFDEEELNSTFSRERKGIRLLLLSTQKEEEDSLSPPQRIKGIPQK
jgi:hypothetical protein